MEFSEVASLISKLNSQKNICLGYHFLLDGNNIYCFFIKSIKCENPHVPYQQQYFLGPFPASVPYLPSNSNFTCSANYEMELVKTISFKINHEGKIVGILPIIQDLIEYCKTLKGDCDYDRVLLEFAEKIEYGEFLENLPIMKH
jgi:hypothetical protein